MPYNDHVINGHWTTGRGPIFTSTDPATGETIWNGHAGDEHDVDDAVNAARNALDAWIDAGIEQRKQHLRAFVEQLNKHKYALAETISLDTGKPLWESLGEVQSMAGKLDLTIQSLHDRRVDEAFEMQGAVAATRYKPYGVMAVFGPFNLPGHLPNGHIMPALLAGNAVVFKPSEQTPLVAQHIMQLWLDSGIPAGVINMIQGARDTGIALAKHPGIDGVLFTGGCPAGIALHRMFADQPQKMLALEMGGNNPLVVDAVNDLDAAAYLTIQSTYITAGQRCTCARRLIVPDGREGDAFLEHLLAMTRHIRVGTFRETPEPFMGPVIHRTAATKLLDAQQQLIDRGADVLLKMRSLNEAGALLSPGLIDVTNVTDRRDEELFGPLLQVIRVGNFDDAIQEANRTAYGLAAGLLSDDRTRYERFFRRVRAGLVYWNRQTTGASGKLPFGGVGVSGNHHPAGNFSIDYCNYPVASIEYEHVSMPEKLSPGIVV